MTHKALSVSRREFLVASAACALSGVAAQAEYEPSAAVPDNVRTALDELVAGNLRFAEGKTRHAHQSSQWRRQLIVSQKPTVTVLGCSDSRVPPELVFDQGLGDLFVIRVAGNVVAPSQIGSVEFAAEQFGTRLVVVLG